MGQEEARCRALGVAARVLEHRHRSAAALKKRLLEKEIAEPDAQYAVERLTALGLLDDSAYAAALAESYAARGYGGAYIRRALREKQLEPEVAEAALEELEPRPDRMEKYIAARLGGRSPDRKLAQKVADGLFRRGFSWDEINAALARYRAALEEDFVE